MRLPRDLSGDELAAVLNTDTGLPGKKAVIFD